MKTMATVLAAGFVLAVSLNTAPSFADEPAYVGAEKCKMCHNSPAKGAQFSKWVESKHAKAFAILATEEAKKIAAGKRIADPQKASECLKCHVTGHGAPAARLIDKYKVTDGVGCESCHGAGGAYWKMDVMKDRAKSVAAGMIVPGEKTCTGCHNAESPTFKGFDFATAIAKVAHPDPKRAATKYSSPKVR